MLFSIKCISISCGRQIVTRENGEEAVEQRGGGGDVKLQR